MKKLEDMDLTRGPPHPELAGVKALKTDHQNGGQTSRCHLCNRKHVAKCAPARGRFFVNAQFLHLLMCCRCLMDAELWTLIVPFFEFF